MTKALEQDEKKLNQRLKKAYEEEAARLEKTIASYYSMYGENNVIEYRNLIKSLTPEEYRLLMTDMDTFAVRYPQYAHLLPARRSAYLINRYEGLQMSIKLQQLRIGAIEQEEMNNHLETAAKRSYDAVLAKTGAVGTENANIYKAIVNTDWTKKGNFSSKIWSNADKLLQVLSNEIANGMARGDNYQKLVNAMRQKFRVGHNEAMRLVYTEGTFVMNEASAQAIQQDFDYYAVSPVRDGKACENCLSIASTTAANPVRYVDRIAGVNFPPFHPWCRCSHIIVVPDKQAWIERYVTLHGGDPDISEQKEKAKELLRSFVA